MTPEQEAELQNQLAHIAALLAEAIEIVADMHAHEDSELLAETAAELMGLFDRSEEHTSELQSRSDLVCRLLLEKKKKRTTTVQSDETQSLHPAHTHHL